MKVKIGVQKITECAGKMFIILNGECCKFSDFKSQQEKKKCIKYLREFYKSKHGLKCEILREV